MQRDMNLIREILLECESSESGIVPDPVRHKAFEDPRYGYHCLLLIEAGLAVGNDHVSDGGTPVGAIVRLTWTGHEFIDAARDPSRWAKAMGVVKVAGGIAFGVLVKVLAEIAAEQVGLKR